MRPFFSYYGGKWRDTPRHYPAPQHDTIVEPFAGSAGYSVRYHGRKVILCEIDPIVAGVWAYLLRVKAAEIRALPDVPMGGTVDDIDAPQEARWLIGFWLNRAPSGPRKSPSAWMRGGIRPGSFWGPRVRETIAAQVGRIRHWRIIHGSYEAAALPHVATWFVDPPYQVAGSHYRYGSKQIDYSALGAWCRARDGQVIVCEGGGADWLPFRTLGDVKTARSTRAVEVVYVGGTAGADGTAAALSGQKSLEVGT